MKKAECVAELLVRALAKSVVREFTEETGEKPIVCLERVIHQQSSPYYFVQALKTRTERSFAGFLLTFETELSYCIPHPAEETDYEAMMQKAERMVELLRVIEIREGDLACWGQNIKCAIDAKGITVSGSFTLRFETPLTGEEA